MANPFLQKRSCRKIEDYRSGYPQFTALLSAHPGFQNVRKFTRTRLRLLLLKQDEITILEDSLDEIDSNENCPLFLGCSRRDKNAERLKIVKELSSALEEYDVMLKRNHQVLSLPSSKPRDLVSLKRWIQGTASVSRKESAFLEAEDDIANLTGSADSAISSIEDLVGDFIFWMERGIRRIFPTNCMKRRHKLTSDDHIFLPGPYLCLISRMLTCWFATAVLMVPVIILCNISSDTGRLVTIAISAGAFLSTVSVFTNARTMEVFTAGASYAAVLVVFTSASGNYAFSRNC